MERKQSCKWVGFFFTQYALVFVHPLQLLFNWRSCVQSSRISRERETLLLPGGSSRHMPPSSTLSCITFSGKKVTHSHLSVDEAKPSQRLNSQVMAFRPNTDLVRPQIWSSTGGVCFLHSEGTQTNPMCLYTAGDFCVLRSD